MRALVEESRVQAGRCCCCPGRCSTGLRNDRNGQRQAELGHGVQECEVSACLMEMDFLQDGWLWDT